MPPLSPAVSSATAWPKPTSGGLVGPWEQAFYFTLRGPVRSKSNYRHDARGSAAWAELSAFADQVFLAARAARPRGWVAGVPGTPRSERPRVVACVFARSNLDVGNLDKSILDAVEAPKGKGSASAGVVMVDDSQVAASLSWGVLTAHDQGALVAFARLAPDATMRDVAAASGALMGRCAELLEGPDDRTPADSRDPAVEPPND